jgi:hypothetical protein
VFAVAEVPLIVDGGRQQVDKDRAASGNGRRASETTCNLPDGSLALAVFVLGFPFQANRHFESIHHRSTTAS